MKARRGKLEPYALDILTMYCRGETFAQIVEWLSQPPRNLDASRQHVHQWVHGRVRKLKARSMSLQGVDMASLVTASRQPNLAQRVDVQQAGDFSPRIEGGDGGAPTDPESDVLEALTMEDLESIGAKRRKPFSLEAFRRDEHVERQTNNPFFKAS